MFFKTHFKFIVFTSVGAPASASTAVAQQAGKKAGTKVLYSSPSQPPGGIAEGSSFSDCDGDVLSANDKAAGDYGGFAVAIDSNSILMGAPSDDNAHGLNSGAVYLFNQTGGAWSQAQKIMSGSQTGGDYFGCSVALRGNYGVVGASYADPFGDSSGMIVPMHRNGSTMVVEAPITDWEGAAFDQFGYSTAIGNEWMLVSAPYHTVSGQLAAGKVSAFRRFGGSGGSWGWHQDFHLPVPHAFDDLGLSVAMQDNSFAAGSPFREVAGMTDAGAVLVGEAQLVSQNPFAANWATDVIVASDAQPNDHFGSTVVLDGNALYISAPDADMYGNANIGVVYVFRYTGFATYVQVGRFTPYGNLPVNSRFGVHMAAGNGTLVVTDAFGNIYKYQQPDLVNPWLPIYSGAVQKPSGASSGFPQSVGVAAPTVVIGDSNHAFSPNGAEGAMYVTGSNSADDCVNAVAIAQGIYTGCTFNATPDGADDCASTAWSKDVWFKLTGTAQNAGPWRVSLRSNYDSAVSVHTGCPGNPANIVSCDDDRNGNFDARAHFGVQAGQTYLIRVSGFAGFSGPFELTARRNTCPADIAPPTIGDGQVNVQDLLLVVSNWGWASVADIAPAPDGNYATNIEDLLAVVAAWGACP